MSNEWNTVLLIAFVCFGCADQIRQPEKLPEDSTQVSVSAPPVALVPDTCSGYFEDFNFFTLRGEGAMDSVSRDHPYAEVRFRHDSVIVTKWMGAFTHSIFRIRLFGDKGIFSQNLQELSAKEDSWLFRYLCTPQYLLKFKYFGETVQPHNWQLYSFEVIRKGPIVLAAEVTQTKNYRPIDFQIPNRNEVWQACLIRYCSSDGYLYSSYDRLIGPLFERNGRERLPPWQKGRLSESVFWTHFTNRIVAD